VLLVSLLTSFARVRRFCFWLVGFVVVLSSLALLQYHEVIDIPSLAELQVMDSDDETGEVTEIIRLRSTGIYNDPNDLCLILCVGMAFSLYRFTERADGPFRFLWLGTLCLFGYALALTQSRGGFLAMLTGLMVFFTARFGWRKTIPLAAVVVPVFVLFFAGRQTNVDLSSTEDTAQMRIGLWKEGLELFKSSPVFGIGQKEFAEEVYFVAHNSFIHTFTELGFFGGTMFTGVFFLSAWSLHRLRKNTMGAHDFGAARLRPYLLGALSAYVVGMLSLSRAYIEPTYMVPGLAAAFIALPEMGKGTALPRLSVRLIALVIAASIVMLGAHYVCVKLLAS
jgi:hypothetical protein